MTAAAVREPLALVARLGRPLGLTEGQVYTVVVSLAVATGLAVGGIPATLEQKGARAAPAAAAPPAPPPAAAPAEAAPPPAGGLAPPPQPPAEPASPAEPPAPQQPGAPAAAPVTPADEQPPPAARGRLFARVGAPGAPAGVAVARDGTVFVGTNNGTANGAPGPSRVLAYSADGDLTRTYAVTGQPADHELGLTALALDPGGGVVVADAAGQRVLRIDPATGRQQVLTTLLDVAPCLVALGADPCEPGLSDERPVPTAVAVDGRGRVYVADPQQGTIWRLDPGERTAQSWHTAADYATGAGPTGLALTPDGGLVFTVGATLDPGNAGSAGLYRVSLDDPAERALVTSFDPAEEPAAVAVGASGVAYVALLGSSAIVGVEPDGSRAGRFDADDDPQHPLDRPAGLAVATGRLLVTNQSSGARSANWTVLALDVADRPVTR